MELNFHEEDMVLMLFDVLCRTAESITIGYSAVGMVAALGSSETIRAGLESLHGGASFPS